MLLLAAPLVLGLCIEASGERATLFGLEGPGCLVSDNLGQAACPGCGLTRSTALLMHGQWGAASAVHPAGWLVGLLCGLGVLLYADIARRGQRTRTHHRLLRTGQWTFATAIVAVWLARWLNSGLGS